MSVDQFRLLRPMTVMVMIVWLPSVLSGQAGPGSVAAPPLPSATGTPVDSFRHLLAAPLGERERFLAGKSLQQRKVLETSLVAYENLSSEEREERLRALELRFRLTSLLQLALSNRAERLQLMPEQDRSWLAERLRIFDQFSSEDQKLLLENERIMRVLTSSGGTASLPRGDVPLTGSFSNRLHEIEVQITRWQLLPPERRARLQNNFERVFEVPQRLSPEEQAKIKESLERLKNLAPAQREQCFRNFTRFADLSPAERRQFLIDVQEWSRLKPAERELWHKLVSGMPPLPPPVAPPLPHLSPFPPKSVALTN